MSDQTVWIGLARHHYIGEIGVNYVAEFGKGLNKRRARRVLSAIKTIRKGNNRQGDN